MTVATTPTVVSPLTNTFSVALLTGTDPVPTNNSVTASNTITYNADVGISNLVVSPTPTFTPSNSATLNYTFNVINNGPSGAPNVTVTVPIPAGTTFQQLTEKSGPAFVIGAPSGGQVQATMSLMPIATGTGAAISVWW